METRKVKCQHQNFSCRWEYPQKHRSSKTLSTLRVLMSPKSNGLSELGSSREGSYTNTLSICFPMLETLRWSCHTFHSFFSSRSKSSHYCCQNNAQCVFIFPAQKGEFDLTYLGWIPLKITKAVVFGPRNRESIMAWEIIREIKESMFRTGKFFSFRSETILILNLKV